VKNRASRAIVWTTTMEGALPALAYHLGAILISHHLRVSPPGERPAERRLRLRVLKLVERLLAKSAPSWLPDALESVLRVLEANRR
jgi:hypothetical protein